MDIPIKAKSFEIEAIEMLNGKAPEMYKGKNHGFYWAAHEANLKKERIDWKRVAEFRLEKIFSGDAYDDRASLISHLTLDDHDYKEISQYMTEWFSLKRPVQKAYCARNIIKWSVMQLLEDKNDNNYLIEGENDFYHMSIDKKLDIIYDRIMEIERRMN